MIFMLMDGCSDSLVEQQSCPSFKLVCIGIILLLLANHGLLRFKLLGRNVDLLQVMAPKRQNQHDSLRKFNITAVFLLLLVACKEGCAPSVLRVRPLDLRPVSVSWLYVRPVFS